MKIGLKLVRYGGICDDMCVRITVKKGGTLYIITGDISKMSINDKLEIQANITDERELKKREIIALERIAAALESRR